MLSSMRCDLDSISKGDLATISRAEISMADLAPISRQVPPEAEMAEVAALMVQKRFNHLPVVDAEGVVLGIVTSPDVLRHFLSRFLEEGEICPRFDSAARVPITSMGEGWTEEAFGLKGSMKGSTKGSKKENFFSI